LIVCCFHHVTWHGTLVRFSKWATFVLQSTKQRPDSTPSTHVTPTHANSNNIRSGRKCLGRHHQSRQLNQSVVLPGPSQSSDRERLHNNHPQTKTSDRIFDANQGRAKIWWWNNIDRPRTKRVSFNTDKFSKESFRTSTVSEHEFAKTQMSRAAKPK